MNSTLERCVQGGWNAQLNVGVQPTVAIQLGWVYFRDAHVPDSCRPRKMRKPKISGDWP